MKKDELKYRFFLEVPKHIRVVPQVFSLGFEHNINVDFLGEDEGVLRKTVYFLANGSVKNINNFKNNLNKINTANN